MSNATLLAGFGGLLLGFLLGMLFQRRRERRERELENAIGRSTHYRPRG